MILRPLNMDDKDEAMQAHRELALDGFDFLLDSFDEKEPWTSFLERVDSVQRGENLPSGYVSATFLVAEVDGQIVGRVSIRHKLNEFLERRGGHIGYGVRPEFRGRGLATEILLRALEITRTLGVERVLITCNDANTASSRVIEKCGGILENIVELDDGEKLRRYWIVSELSQ